MPKLLTPEEVREIPREISLPKFLKVNEVAEILGRSRQVIYGWIKNKLYFDDGDLFKVGGDYLIRQDCIDRLKKVVPQASERLKGKNEKLYVYFIRAENGLVKIGKAVNPKNRFGTIKTASPVPVELLAFTEADSGLEKFLNKYFAEHRSHGEWFKVNKEIEDLIDKINANESVIKSIRSGNNTIRRRIL